MKMVWVHEQASLRGGAERYVLETATRLASYGVRSTLLYDVRHRVDPAFVAAFEGAYPLVDARRQLAELAPDAVYLHRLGDEADAARIRAATGAPVFRFFHDHKLFCLREHKTSPLDGSVCTKVAKASNCYPCLGFVRRAEGAIPLRMVSASALVRERNHSRDLDGFVVASRYLADHVAAHGLDARRIHVLPLSAHPAPGRSTDAPARELGHVLFVGSLLRGKGIDVLLRAMARTPSVRRLTLAGAGAQKDELVALVDRLGLTSRVDFVGHLGADALEAAYQRACLGVLPSRVPETFGLAGLEASARGLPVIASDVGGVSEWLEHGRNGLRVPANDVEALASALDELLQHPERAERMGAAGRERAATLFNPQRHDAMLLDLVQRALRERAA
jgi:glycosyltransferase involved in cell wall biosynthesis